MIQFSSKIDPTKFDTKMPRLTLFKKNIYIFKTIFESILARFSPKYFEPNRLKNNCNVTGPK